MKNTKSPQLALEYLKSAMDHFGFHDVLDIITNAMAISMDREALTNLGTYVTERTDKIEENARKPKEYEYKPETKKEPVECEMENAMPQLDSLHHLDSLGLPGTRSVPCSRYTVDEASPPGHNIEVRPAECESKSAKEKKPITLKVVEVQGHRNVFIIKYVVDRAEPDLIHIMKLPGLGHVSRAIVDFIMREAQKPELKGILEG